ncbi:MAG TPA: DUF924 family protein [Burkholderiales bacterium]|nr:DUF924 family protein [Burkholderiales bacterium]
MPDVTAEEIHRYWFDDALAAPSQASTRMSFWFRPARETDRYIMLVFGPVLREAALGALDDWQLEARLCLSLLIVFDQFPRNIHRGTPAAFDHDAAALRITRRGIAAGHLRELSALEQAFFLMPYQHCENAALQREGIALYDRMLNDAPPEWREFLNGFVSYARKHAALIERFGRFPHRNAILGRVSTAAERAFLETNSESFGQEAPL